MSTEENIPVGAYIEHLKLTGKSGAAKTNRSLLNTFESWLYKEKKNQSIENVTINTVDEYLSTVGSPRTVRGAIRGYFSYRYKSLSMGDPRADVELQRITQMGMLHPKRKVKKLSKISLSSDELKILLKNMRETEGITDELIAGVIVLFYFGARPGELEEHLRKSKISFEKREMFLLTEKTLVERYLAWHPKLDPYMKTWYAFVTRKGGVPYAGEWVTKTLKNRLGVGRKIKGVSVTARTARRTFQTQMRLLNVPDITIRMILGHTDQSMSDVYTDWTQFSPIIKEVLVNKHYMIDSGVL